MRTTIDKPKTLCRSIAKSNNHFFGMLKPQRHADGPHDMESIRASIVNGRASEHADKRKRSARKSRSRARKPSASSI